MIKVAFLDRDGVINEDHGYVHRIEDFTFTRGCFETLQELQARDYQLIIITNQSGIGCGYYSENDYQRLTTWYLKQLKQQGINILDVFYCPHAPQAECSCRKPQPGMLLQAQQKYPELDLSNAFMVGDKLSDLEAADRAGVGSLYLISSDSTLIAKANAQNYHSKLKIISGIQQLL